ncbi:MerR family transcriptional regulator [Pulveribacter suum]|uniref:Cobalamin-binding protein n=1 Tax=Pulveribacter suum TaxID=2116657 RepID=A0A2P1NJW5_9BURK|nr:cobalamin B12-binding domain-containing protein [Pulveribacter suum]AVP57359.1 cobalamin-binding protein [Pulveribacter suum]
MSALLGNPAAATLPIAEVERETGLGKDVLRVWEKRYGFPAPLRDGSGDRRYPTEQVRRLKLIRRLLDAGLRPGKVVQLEESALDALLSRPTPARPLLSLSRTSQLTTPPCPAIGALLDTIASHDPQALRHALGQAQARMGLAAFVGALVAPLAHAVGDAWAQGRFEIFEEHLFTEVVTGVLRQAIATLPPPAGSAGPRVLLTTLPQELHGLGLLMVEAVLALEGCSCISLGTQTPAGDIVQAARAHRADVVALSFTNAAAGTQVLSGMRELRERLPGDVALWVGGGCLALYRRPLEGVTALRELSGLPALVAQWRSDCRGVAGAAAR